MSLLFTLLVLLGAARAEAPYAGPDCASMPCTEVLPGATAFRAVPDKPYLAGVDAQGAKVGWVVLSTDVVDVKGYSGKPLETLVGLDTSGRITGSRVLKHSEPILLVGIPESALDAFVDQYDGVKADAKVVVGKGSSGGDVGVDAVSGATVTTLSLNQTILDTARLVGEDAGVVHHAEGVPGHWVTSDTPWTWRQMERYGVLGHIDVGPEQLGERANVDLTFTLADAPQIGRALLGDRQYAFAMKQLGPGQHLLVILNDGPGSFKGSGFVRGGIFDRIRLEQDLSTVTFTDRDYWNLPEVQAKGAPRFREGGWFVTRKPIDPGRTMQLVFLGSRFTLNGFDRDFQSFEASFRMPRSVWALDGPDPDDAVWKGAWAARWPVVLAVGLYLLAVAGLFIARRWTSGNMERLQRVHTAFLVASFAILGVWLHVQPSITQLLTLVGSVAGQWRWRLFLSDPFVFTSWVFIAVVTVVWGRGVFCGWVCPYGAMSELLFGFGQKIGLKKIELSDPVHARAKLLRYGVLAVLVTTFLFSPETAEKMAEIEPFKSTFFVPFWTRGVALASWWLVLAGAAMVWYRPFCRYLCPLGAGLALPSSFRLSGPHRRDFCTKCKICYRGCEPRAIDYKTGKIDPRECLNCWECEANWRDDTVCPPLVRTRRDREKAARQAATAEAAK